MIPDVATVDVNVSQIHDMSADKELSLDDFRSWLIDATKLADSNDTSVTPSGVVS